MRKRYVFILCTLVFSFVFVPVGLGQSQQSSTEVGRKVVRKVDPVYPEVAKRMNLGGTVKLIAVVAADGKVTKVEPVGGSPLLVQAAQSAISQWKYVAGSETREAVELHFTP